MRAVRLLTIGAAWGALALAVSPMLPAAAARGLSVTTPYPAVVVQAGETVTFDLSVSAPGRQRVDLAVTQVPEGWTATLRGGGFVIDGVYTDPDTPPDVQLEVIVAKDAGPGTYRVEVTGRSTAGTDVLPLDLRVSRRAEGRVSLTSEFPRLQGPAGATYSFDLQLRNETPEETVFALSADAPPGWQATVKPVGQEQASSVKVEGGGSTSLTVDVDPPDDTVAGRYPIVVRAVGGGRAVHAQLEVRITGSYGLQVSTPAERLNADVAAGKPTRVALVVTNDGTAPLREVQLSATSPTDWRAQFGPETIEQIPPGQSVPVTLTITPASDAVAGDYIVTVRASTLEASDQVDLRTTVKTSGIWGLVGFALIGAALGGLGLVFRRYGRR